MKILKNIFKVKKQQNFFSTYKNKENVLLNFKRNVNSLESQASRMIVPDNLKREFSESEKENNRLIKAFLISPKEIRVFEHLKGNEKDKILTPNYSWTEVILPLKTDKFLRSKFIKFYTNYVRIGRILEVLDFMAGSCAYKHCEAGENKNDQYIVTVCVDNISFFKSILANEDLILNSYPTFTGRSTIEIRTDVVQCGNLLCSALFLMAARNSSTKKSSPVPQLKLNNYLDGQEECNFDLLRFELGKTNMEKRIMEGTSSLFNTPPSAEESIELHKIFMAKKNLNEGFDFNSIENTRMEKSLLMHLQDKNLHGNVFGGYLMREAFELCWMTALNYSKGDYPEILHIDDIAFKHPVEVGSIVRFISKVCYVKNNILHLIVETMAINLRENKEVKACEFHITLMCPNTQLIPVFPDKYHEGLLYLEAKRRIEKYMRI